MTDPTSPGRDLDATAEVPATTSTRKLSDVLAQYTAGETVASSAAQFFDSPGVTDSIRALSGMDSMGLAAEAVLSGRDSELVSSAEMHRQISGDAAKRIGGAFTDMALGGITDSYREAMAAAAPTMGFDYTTMATGAAKAAGFDPASFSALASSDALRELSGTSSMAKYAMDDDYSDIVRARDIISEIPHEALMPAPRPDPVPVARDHLEETRGLRQDVAALTSAVSLLVNYTESNGTDQGNWNVRLYVIALVSAVIAATTLGVTVGFRLAGG